MYNTLKTFIDTHKDNIFVGVIIITALLLLFTTGFWIYKMIVFLSDFLIVILLAYIAVLVTKILNRMEN